MDSSSSNNIRFASIVLIVTLALFFNSQLFFQHIELTAPSSHHFMYLFATLSAVAVILSRTFGRLPVYLVAPLSGFAYLLATPYFSAAYTFENLFSAINLFEAVMVCCVVGVTHWYTRQLPDAIQDNRRTADDSETPPLLDAELNEIKYEITRARRYNRSITLVMLQPVARILGENEKRQLTAVLRSCFRRTERLYDVGKEGRFVIFCPETTATSAEMLVNRIRIYAHKLQEMHLIFGLATFPDQEVTFEGLLSRARENLRARFGGRVLRGKSVTLNKNKAVGNG
jgi:hypothetical protein